MSKPSWLIALENKWIKNGKDTSPVLTEFNFTKFWNEYGYPYLNGAAHTGFTPVGTVIAYFGETAPENYLVCDGTAYNKTDYPELWTLLSSLTDTTPYVVSGDNTKFKVPDLRGEFLRGTGTNSHTNQGSGAGIGVHQNATSEQYVASSSGQIRSQGVNPSNLDSSHSAEGDIFWYLGNASSYSDNTQFQYTSRPTNTSVLYCIAYKNIYIDAVIGGENTVITNPQEGQGLVYDATNGVWKNGAGGLHEYSTTEKVIGKWIDGRPVYEKTLYCGNLPNSTKKNISHGITNLGFIISFNGFAYFDRYILAIPKPAILSSDWGVDVFVEGTGELILQTGKDRSSFIAYVTIQYTKTTDTV